MKTIRQIGLMVLFSAIAGAATAQETGKVKMKLNYNIAMPVGSFKNDYITNSSFRGGSGEIAYWFNPKFSLGLGVGYQSFYQKNDRQLYKQDGNQVISAVLTNTVETMPVTLNGTFVPMAGSGSKVQPYLTVGAGMNMINFRQYYGEFSDGSTSTSFTAQGGAGVMIPVGKASKGASLQLGANYSVTPYNKSGLTSLNSVGVNAGVVFPIK